MALAPGGQEGGLAAAVVFAGPHELFPTLGGGGPLPTAWRLAVLSQGGRLGSRPPPSSPTLI